MHLQTNNQMKPSLKQTIAILFGGCSSEYSVSLSSAHAVIQNLDKQKYMPIPIGISQNGQWYYFHGDIDKLLTDTWCNPEDCTPATLSPDKSQHGLLLLEDHIVRTIKLDAVFPVLHGKNGEDGTLQGMVELSGIPLIGCGTLPSALCMDKDRAHKLVAASGIRVPLSLRLTSSSQTPKAANFAEQIGYPLFVKPVKAGSSYGITKVPNENALAQAILLAFEYDNEVLLEEAIEGFEVGCAIIGTEILTVGEVDEIELSGGFFDFTEKYTLKTSDIHVPARIDKTISNTIKETAKRIYQILGCRIFARVDMFLTPDGEIVFNEVNTIPGFTEHSRFPGMLKAAGYSFPQILDTIIELGVSA